MNASAEIAKPLPSRRIWALTAGAGAVSALVLLVAVLPAEYDYDPTGLGTLTGIAKLFAPEEIRVPAIAGQAAAQRSIDNGLAFRTDIVRIPLAARGDAELHDRIEYKVAMPKDSTLVYSWRVEGLPEQFRDNFLTQMHGHTIADRQTMTVVDYRLSTRDHDDGELTAAVDGIHGWYIENRANVPVTMVVKLAGFYTLVAPGGMGNEGGIVAEGQAVPAK